MIVVGKEGKNDRWNYHHHMPVLPLLGAIHRLPLLHTYKRLIRLEEIDECSNEFDIGYIINPSLHIDKLFK